MRRPRRSGPALLVAAGCYLAVTTGSLACGYHGSLGDGFSAQHPRSIDVALAVREAIDRGALAKLAPLPGFLALTRANTTLERFREALATGLQDDNARGNTALLLVEAGLWTRYYVDNDRLMSEPHVSGPISGDIVIVTAEPVMQALLSGHMSIGQAIGGGLLVIADNTGRMQQTATALYRAFFKQTH
jgi:hypothetical protein